MFRVRSRRAFDKVLARSLRLLGNGTQTASEGRPYWKVPELWECGVVTPGLAGSPADHVLRTLLLARELGIGWQVFGTFTEDSAEGLTGVFSINHGGRARLPGLDWASFDVESTYVSRTSRTVRRRGPAGS